MQAPWEHQLIALAGQPQTPPRLPFFSYWAGDAAAQRAYEMCATVTARHSKSFMLASQLLPEPSRQAVRALYAFCRTVDDIVDEGAQEDIHGELEYWRRISQDGPARPGDLIAAAWSDTLTRYHIPRRYALQLIDGVARDMSQRRYATFDELSTYCYGVASTVGLMSMYIVGFRSNEAIPYAIKLGVALQLTNILRDVGEDIRRGRIYLPANELQAFGITEQALATGQVTERWRGFMRYQIKRARMLYEESWPGIKLLEREGQMAIGTAAILYSGILDAIERNDYDVFSQRASLSALGKLSRLPSLAWKLRN